MLFFIIIIIIIVKAAFVPFLKYNGVYSIVLLIMRVNYK